MKRPTTQAASANSTTARSGTDKCWRGHRIRQMLPPGDHRPNQVVPLQRRIGEDRDDVREHRDLDQFEVDGMDVRQPVAPVLAHVVEQRPFSVGVVVRAEACRRLYGEQDQHHQHHPAASRVVTYRGVRLAPVEVGKVSERRERALQEVREARRLAADNPPCHAEQQQRDGAVAGQKVQFHPAATLRQPADAEQHDDCPVEQAGGCVPDAHRQATFAQANNLDRQAELSLTHRPCRVTQPGCRFTWLTGSIFTDR